VEFENQDLWNNILNISKEQIIEFFTKAPDKFRQFSKFYFFTHYENSEQNVQNLEYLLKLAEEL
jgi:hypothetical protein